MILITQLSGILSDLPKIFPPSSSATQLFHGWLLPSDCLCSPKSQVHKGAGGWEIIRKKKISLYCKQISLHQFMGALCILIEAL